MDNTKRNRNPHFEKRIIELMTKYMTMVNKTLGSVSQLMELVVSKLGQVIERVQSLDSICHQASKPEQPIHIAAQRLQTQLDQDNHQVLIFDLNQQWQF